MGIVAQPRSKPFSTAILGSLALHSNCRLNHSSAQENLFPLAPSSSCGNRRQRCSRILSGVYAKWPRISAVNRALRSTPERVLDDPLIEDQTDTAVGLPAARTKIVASQPRETNQLPSHALRPWSGNHTQVTVPDTGLKVRCEFAGTLLQAPSPADRLNYGSAKITRLNEFDGASAGTLKNIVSIAP